MEKLVNVPRLRFTDFWGDWNENKLGVLSDVRDGTHESPKYYESGFPFITSKNLSKDGLLYLDNVSYINEEDYIKFNSRSKVEINDILFGMIGTIGNPVLIKRDGFAIKNVALIKQKSDLLNVFLIHYLNGPRITQQFFEQNTGGTQKFLSLSIIRNLKITVPNSAEQNKIALFFSKIDDRLNLLSRKKSLLEQYKKGVMQQLFSQELRFKVEDGNSFADWDFVTLGEIAEKRSAKNKTNDVINVFTNSAAYGIVNQRDFFDKDIANQDNLLNYYIVEKDDFVYNPRISNLAPVGPIGRNHLNTGVMSPLYSVFRIHHGVLDFFELYFSSSFWHEYMKSIANYGARADRMNITNDLFYQMPLPFPCIEEQTKIASFLSALDEKIAQTALQIEKMQLWKKGLLQQMFV